MRVLLSVFQSLDTYVIAVRLYHPYPSSAFLFEGCTLNDQLPAGAKGFEFPPMQSPTHARDAIYRGALFSQAGRRNWESVNSA